MPPPGSYVLEITNHCNLRCGMCNFHSPLVNKRRPKGFMVLPLAARLLKEISEMAEDNPPWVALHGAGESLLHRDFVSILREAGRHRNIDPGFLTNAVLLDGEMSQRVVDSGISWIGFSIDGTDARLFEKYRCGAQYDRVVKNALAFIELARRLRPEMKISVNMTLQEEMKGQVKDFLAFWLRRVDSVSISPVRPVGSRDNLLAREMPCRNRMPCYMLYEMMVISWDGKVSLCCEDWFGEHLMGDAAREGLSDIWRGDQFRKARALHEESAFDAIPLCADCNSWYNAVPEEYRDESLGCKVTKVAWQYMYTPLDPSQFKADD